LELRHHQIIEELIQQGPQSSQRTLHMPQQIDALLTGETLVFTRAHERKHVPHIVYHQHAEAMLRIPGQIAVPGTAWLASAAVVEDMQVQKALRNADWETVWRLLQHNNYVVYIDGGLPGDKLVVRTRRPGDRLQPLGMVHEKKVQDILVDRHVPRNERDQIPLFFAHTHCIWLAGIQIAEPVRLTRNTRRLVRLAVHPIS
jgi:tRNA(Ile)-lysidine synthase